MDILLTGGTGYIGASVLKALLAADHTVTAVVRSETSGEQVAAAGATPIVGDLTDTAWLADQLGEVDAAIHTAAAGDASDADLNDAVISAVVTAFGGTDKPFVHTGGIWTYGSSDAITEVSEPQPIPLTGWRVDSESRLLASDVQASVVQPGLVYGHGGGIPSMIADGPRDDAGALVAIGSGEQHWTTVHVDDLADLYVRVLESPERGLYIGVNGQNPTVAELTAAIAGDQGSVAGTDAEAAERLGGPFAEALLLDQQAAGEKARGLGWTPSAPSLLDLFALGYPADR